MIWVGWDSNPQPTPKAFGAAAAFAPTRGLLGADVVAARGTAENINPGQMNLGWAGLEPATNALKGRCSTIELPTRAAKNRSNPVRATPQEWRNDRRIVPTVRDGTAPVPPRNPTSLAMTFSDAQSEKSTSRRQSRLSSRAGDRRRRATSR